MQSTERSSTSRVPRAAFLRKNWRIIETNDVVSFCCTTGESALCTHMPLPPTTPSPTRRGQSENQSELPVLYSSFPPAIYFTHGSVYVSVLLSEFTSPSPIVPLWPNGMRYSEQWPKVVWLPASALRSLLEHRSMQILRTCVLQIHLYAEALPEFSSLL